MLRQRATPQWLTQPNRSQPNRMQPNRMQPNQRWQRARPKFPQPKELVTTQQNDPRPNHDVAVPIRMCIGCRSHLPQDQLVRCAWGPDGPAIGRDVAGRGAWLCSIDCFDTAVRRRAFTRAWRCEVSNSTLGALRIAFESVITNMRDLAAVGTNSGTPMPTKG